MERKWISKEEAKEMWPDNNEKKIQAAIECAFQWGPFPGEHHKQWCIDQMLRILCGISYQHQVDEQNSDKDYEPWDEGIAP